MGETQNRAKCVCLARGIWIFSLDSDDELMNRTAEMALKTHQRTGADMVEFQILQIDFHGQCQVFRTSRISSREADNNTLIRAFRNRALSWNLAYRMIACSIYQKALLLMGSKICMAVINIGADKLHFAIILRFVHKFVQIDYAGYLYYRNIKDNSIRRTPNTKPILATVDKYIAQIYTIQLRDSLDIKGLHRLCSVIEQ
jgi:hypothetical protein